MLFFTADTHFGGTEIINRENRPFTNHKEMDLFLIKTFNTQANRSDTIYCLGDFINYNELEKDNWKESFNYVKEIDASIVLLLGNNEERVIKEEFDNNFESFKEYLLNVGFRNVFNSYYINILNQRVFLNHYPSRHDKTTFNLFGHTHRITGFYKPYGFNVGVDVNNFKLFSEKDLEKLYERKIKFLDIDEDVLDW